MTLSAPTLPHSPVLSAEMLSLALTQGGTRRTVLRDMSFAVGAGDSVALIGETRSGRDELLRTILGLLPPELAPALTGVIYLMSRPLAPEAAHRQLLRQHVGVVLRDGARSLDPTMRVRQQIAARAHGRDLAALLAQVGMDGAADLAAYPHELSAERRQRAQLAMALGHDPALLILDEPTEGLDKLAAERLLRDLAAWRAASGRALLILTQHVAVAARVAERAMVLHGGQIVEHAAMPDLLARPAHPYAEALLAARCELTADRSRRRRVVGSDRVLMVSLEQAASGCTFRGPCPAGSNRCAQAPTLGPALLHPGQVACWNVRAPGRQVAPPPRWPTMPPSGGPPLLRLEAVSRPAQSRERLVTERLAPVHGVDLRLGPREAVAVVGASGAGKSTLLRIAAGLLAPAAGRRAYTGATGPQMLFADPRASLPPWLRVDTIIADRLTPGALSAAERATRVEEALAAAQLAFDFAPMQAARLTPGQAQRVAIARAMIVPPPLLICDDPLSRLDVSEAAGLLNLIVALRRASNMALLFATDDMAVARYVADRIVVLEQGRIVEDAPAEQVAAAPATPAAQALAAAAAPLTPPAVAPPEMAAAP